MRSLAIGIVGIPDTDAAREALGEVAQHEDQSESVGLVAGDTDEPGGREIGPRRILVEIRHECLVEEELCKEVGRAGVGQPGQLIAPFPAADQL